MIKLFALFFLVMIPSVSAIDFFFEVNTTNFNATQEIILYGTPNETIFLTYGGDGFTTGLTSILPSGKSVNTAFDVSLINITDGKYIDIVDVNASNNLTQFVLHFNVTAGFTNATEQPFLFSIREDELPFEKQQPVTITVTPSINITVFYPDWITGPISFISDASGISTFVVDILVPQDAVRGTTFRTLTFSTGNGTASRDFEFNILDVFEPCSHLLPNRDEPNLNEFVKQSIIYNDCLAENKQTIIIQKNITKLLPGDVEGLLRALNKEKDKRHAAELLGRDEVISANKLIIDILEGRLLTVEAKSNEIASRLNGTIAQFEDEQRRMEEETVGKGWKTTFWWLLFFVTVLVIAKPYVEEII